MNDRTSPDGTATDDLTRIMNALGGLASLFATDGYTMTVAGLENRRLKIVIEASENACAECLVPHDLMVGLVKTELPADVGVSDIEIIYPTVAK
jgi:hypothetical protein